MLQVCECCKAVFIARYVTNRRHHNLVHPNNLGKLAVNCYHNRSALLYMGKFWQIVTDTVNGVETFGRFDGKFSFISLYL